MTPVQQHSQTLCSHFLIIFLSVRKSYIPGTKYQVQVAGADHPHTYPPTYHVSYQSMEETWSEFAIMEMISGVSFLVYQRAPPEVDSP